MNTKADTNTKAMGFEVRDNVAWITFNRPEAYNAINSQATTGFYDIVNRCSVDRSVRAVVLTGASDRAFVEKRKPSFVGE